MTDPSLAHCLVELLEGKEFNNIYNVGGNLKESSFTNKKINNLPTFETENKVSKDSLIKKIQGSEKRLSDLYQSILQNEDASIAGIELLIVNNEIDFQLISPLVKFDYFLILPNHLRQLPNPECWIYSKNFNEYSLFQRKHLLSDVDERTFVIATPTYDRRPKRETEPLLRRCIQTVKSQTYTKYIHLIVGDHFDDDLLFDAITGKEDKIVALNFPLSMEREITPINDKFQMWKNGGANTLNYAVWLIKQSKGILARLDDDDQWRSDHLKLMAKQYEEKGERCAFVFCNAWGAPSDYPVESQVFHSSVSWRPSLLPLQYQKHPNKPADGYLWGRMTAFMKAHHLISARIHIDTIVYDRTNANQVHNRT